MKHTLKVTLILVALFFLSQVVGLLITNAYIDHKATAESGTVTFSALPYDIERPPVEEQSSFIFIITAILIGTVLVLLLIRFKKTLLWKIWYFLAVLLCLSIALSAFMNHYLAFFVSLGFSLLKIFKPNVIIHNLTEVFIYGGLAAIFVPIMNLFAVIILLLLISAYDFIAVFKSKHMVAMAKFQTKSKVFAGLMIPYKRVKADVKPRGKGVIGGVKTAILGGGDIGFPLLFAGVVMKGLMLQNTIFIGFLKSLIIPFFVSIALLALFYIGKKDKFYPAMPFLSVGCFVGYGILFVINLLLV
jgi:presenilin-like A22 family membrane protease